MKISSEILTRDEIQHRVIAELFSHSIREHLVFHGGTMLRVCALPSYRFSEDIDMFVYGIDEEAFFPALSFSMSSGLISVKITPQKIVEEVAVKLATLPGIEQPSGPKGK